LFGDRALGTLPNDLEKPGVEQMELRQINEEVKHT
jgi:hypothetical protein